MAEDRLVEVRVKGLRTLADVRLRLGGLTVLLGENGAGKSSLIEVFELLRKAAEPNYVQNLGAHGGLPLLLRQGAADLEIGVRIEGAGDPIDYRFAIAFEGNQVVVVREAMDLGPRPGHADALEVIRRTRASNSVVFDQQTRQRVPISIDPGALLVSAFGVLPPQEAIGRTVAVLRRVDVHVPFDVRALWVCKERGWTAPLRDPSLIEPAVSLARVGDNLANAFHSLKNEQSKQHWDETMDLVRLGLGQDVASINTQTAAGGGQIALSMELRGLGKQIPAAAMADGSLAYLAFIALARLGPPRSLLAFDEPELHLHPRLLVRVLGLFESLARKGPVVLATQSDRLLDALSDPVASAVLCRVSSDGGPSPRWATELARPNAEALAKWLERYRGLGELRGVGAEDLVMTEAS
ncbi:MAG TPA: AAA family ATPase [Byssovorax sp.]|jgi:predicted ATPase